MKAKKRNSRGCGSFPVCGISVVNQKRQKIGALQKHEKVAKTNKSTGNPKEFPVLLVETAGLEPVTSCV